MSSNSKSATEPGTPSKPKDTKEVENRAVKTPSRTPSRTGLSDASTPSRKNSVEMKVEAVESQKLAGEEVLVPSTIPRSQTGETQDGNHSNSSDSSLEEDEENVRDAKANLEPFDWEEFETRWESVLKEARDKENDIAQECETLFQAFHIWASVASMKDTERSMKRLKTRERYIQLEEKSLEGKVEHYNTVVTAFEQAISLLNLPSRAR